MGEYLTAKMVAAKLKVHEETVWSWLRNGKLRGDRLNKRNWRISESALNDFLSDKSSGGEHAEKE